MERITTLLNSLHQSNKEGQSSARPCGHANINDAWREREEMKGQQRVRLSSTKVFPHRQVLVAKAVRTAQQGAEPGINHIIKEDSSYGPSQASDVTTRTDVSGLK